MFSDYDRIQRIIQTRLQQTKHPIAKIELRAVSFILDKDLEKQRKQFEEDRQVEANHAADLEYNETPY